MFIFLVWISAYVSFSWGETHSCHVLNSTEVLDCSLLGLTSADASEVVASVAISTGGKYNLSHNQLTTVNPKLLNVHVLDLSFNEITTIVEIPTSSLTWLNLSSNQLSEVASLVPLFRLEGLNLRNNSLTKVPQLPSSLVHLDLSLNQLEYLSPADFDRALELKSLIVENNPLKATDGVFRHLIRLESLSFRGCSSLKQLSTTILFADSLTTVSLAFCNLTELPHVTKQQFIRLKRVELEGNPWSCSEDLEWITQLRLPDETADDVRCSTPYNISVRAFYWAQWRNHITRITVSSSLLFIVIGLALTLVLSFRREMRRRSKIQPYIPLTWDSLPQRRGNPVYVSTVI